MFYLSTSVPLNETLNIFNRLLCLVNEKEEENTKTLYGLPKIHQPNVPIRLVVSDYSSPAQKITKSLNNFSKIT